MSEKTYIRMAIEDILIPNKEEIEITSVIVTDNFGNTYESGAYFVYLEDKNGEEIPNE